MVIMSISIFIDEKAECLRLSDFSASGCTCTGKVTAEGRGEAWAANGDPLGVRGRGKAGETFAKCKHCKQISPKAKLAHCCLHGVLNFKSLRKMIEYKWGMCKRENPKTKNALEEMLKLMSNQKNAS